MTASKPHAAKQGAARGATSDAKSAANSAAKSAELRDATRSIRCPRCGSRFDCGRHAEPFDCWCKSMPALPASQLDPRGRCLCPECLAAAVATGHVPAGGPQDG
ncbi:conserved hypothetical protein [Paraburkholderia tropica]|nr:conserved hypothetical protein [Paraburkholderia tropica]